MNRLAIPIALVLTACASHYQMVRLVNRTSHPIDQVYVYPIGSADHGAPRASLAPSASTQIRVKPGNIEVLAVSAKIKIDERTRDQPSASHDLELKGPVEVVFYDAGHKPPGIDRPGVFGIEFVFANKNLPAKGGNDADGDDADPGDPSP